jgi:hypothetical protein
MSNRLKCLLAALACGAILAIPIARHALLLWHIRKSEFNHTVGVDVNKLARSRWIQYIPVASGQRANVMNTTFYFVPDAAKTTAEPILAWNGLFYFTALIDKQTSAIVATFPNYE